MDDARELPAKAADGRAVLGIGALAIGNVKYRTQQALLRHMRESGSAQYLGYAECLTEARRHVG
jgi:methylene-tetrahydromethanopterin dehydrogenase